MQREDHIGSVIEPKTDASSIGWRGWAGRGATAALEQGSVSGTNFALSVAAARWLEPAGYGRFAVAFSLLLLAAAVYQALFLVPLMVHLPTLEDPQRAGYLRALLRIHAWGSAAALTAGGLACWALAAFGRPAIAALALASTFSAAALTFQWMTRDAHYCALSPRAPARGSMLYGATLLAGLTALWAAATVEAWSAIGLMGVAACAAGALQLWELGRRLAAPDPGTGAREVWRISFRFGRWELWNSIAQWAPVHLTFPVTAGLLGPSLTGALRALQNFAMPLNQIVAALSRLAFPYLCGQAVRGGDSLRQGRRIAWAALGMGLAYTAALWLLAGPAVRLLYGGAYDEHAWLTPLAILPMAFWGGAQALGLALRAAGRFPSVLIGSVAVGVAFAAAVVPATNAYGLTGALAAAAGAQALGLALLVLFARESGSIAPSERAIPAEGGSL